MTNTLAGASPGCTFRAGTDRHDLFMVGMMANLGPYPLLSLTVVALITVILVFFGMRRHKSASARFRLSQHDGEDPLAHSTQDVNAASGDPEAHDGRETADRKRRKRDKRLRPSGDQTSIKAWGRKFWW